MMTAAMASAALLSAVLLAGCGSSGSTGSHGLESGYLSASPATSAKAEACDLLTAAQVKALAESTLSKLPAATTAGITFCQWSASGLQVTISSVPANEWLKQFPELMNELDKDGTLAKFPETKQKMNEALAKIRAGQALPPGEACRVFADVLELRGYPAGQRQAVFIYPNSTNPQGLSGQSCLDSTFITVSLLAPGVTGTTDQIQRVQTALEQAHAAVKN